MNNYIKQIWYELRHQPVVTITSILGTAFAIFLVMAVFMTSSLSTVAVAPESNRPRLLVGQDIHIKMENYEGAGTMSNSYALKLYGNLNGIEKISFTSGWTENRDVSVKDGDCVSLLTKNVDDVFWKIFDFKFISGKPFDKDVIDSRLNKVILSESSAKKLFGNTDVAGEEVKINHIPYVVQGVTANTSPLLQESYANIYLPYAPESEDDLWLEGFGGDTKVYMLMEEGVNDNDIRDQVISRYATLNSTLKKEGKIAIYHHSPHTTETLGLDFGANTDPEPESPRRMRYAVYFILLLLPAINLSSMTRSRLRRRVAEIGVRRAYGATKWGILNRFLSENLVLTLIGGVIGLILCIIFVAFFSNLFISYGGTFGSGDIMSANPTFRMMLNFKTFGIAMLLCLILNLISTGMPAWRASRINPAEAISGKND